MRWCASIDMACLCNSARAANHARIAVAMRNSRPSVTIHEFEIDVSKVESANRAPMTHIDMPHAVSFRALSHMTNSPISSSCVPRSHRPEDSRMAFLANRSAHDARATSKPKMPTWSLRFKCLTCGHAAIMHRPKKPANQYIFTRAYTSSSSSSKG